MMSRETIKVNRGLRNVLLVLSTVALLTGSVLVWFYVNRSVEEQRDREFSNAVANTKEKVMDEVKSIVERLYDLRGFVSSMELNDEMWRNYLISSGVENRYQGIYSFAFAPRVLRGELTNYITKTRADEKEKEYEKYSVFPESQNAELLPIKYLYTSDVDISLLLGYDVGTSETQVGAVTESVSGDTPVVTDLLHLSTVIPGNQKMGYEIILPVYNKVNITDYPKPERRKYFVGMVGIWVFPQGFASYIDPENDLIAKGVSFSVFDGENKLFTMGETGGELEEETQINILNKNFRFDFMGKKQKILSPLSENLPWLTLVVIILVNIMWVATVWAIILSRRAAERLAAEATKDLRKFKQAVEGVSDLVVITDQEGTISFINKASESITGFSREGILGKNPALWGGQMDDDFYKKFWKTIKIDKKPFWGNVTNKRKTGELYEAEINVSPIVDENGNLLFFVGIERDLSKVKAVERMKTEFISLASHQLRTPLSAVKWFGKMLISGDAGKLNPTQSDYIKKINESNEREIKLVNSLLNVSRIESDKIEIVPGPTDLGKIVANVVTDFKFELGRGKRKMVVVFDKKIPLLNLDEDLIRHVYSNLVSNAVHYTKTGGKITLKVFLAKNLIMTEVKDNGIGIPKGEQKRVFEKFFRASNALKKETDGTGLGLYLSKTIIESSGGKMGFRSSE